MKCYIFDIDGTLASAEHRLHHITGEKKDWSAFFDACDQDTPIPHMVNLFRAIWIGTDSIVLFCTGRSDDVKAKTVHWLNEQLLPPGHEFDSGDVYMRKAGDHRADTVVKAELLDQIRADGYEPVMVFEDRKQCVDLWRSRGIPCCQVAPGDF